MGLHCDDFVVYLFSRKHRAKSKLLVRDGPFGSSFGLDSEASESRRVPYPQGCVDFSLLMIWNFWSVTAYSNQSLCKIRVLGIFLLQAFFRQIRQLCDIYFQVVSLNSPPFFNYYFSCSIKMSHLSFSYSQNNVFSMIGNSCTLAEPFDLILYVVIPLFYWNELLLLQQD